MPEENIRIEKAPPLDNVYARTGQYRVRIEPGDVSLYPAEHFPCETYGVLLSWEKGTGNWLTVRATGSDNQPFTAGANDRRTALEKHAAVATPFAARVMEDAWDEEWGFAVGSASVQFPTRIECQIDTNHPKFVRYASEPANFTPEGDGLLIHLRVNFFQGQGNAQHLDRMRLQLVLRPDPSLPRDSSWSGANPRGLTAPRDKCLAAVDLGNTNTTVAILDPVQRETRQISLLSFGVSKEAGVVALTSADAPPIPSDVRLDMVRSWLPPGGSAPPTRRFPDYERFPDDDNGNAVQCVIGGITRYGKVNARSLILGSKRMAAARADGAIPVFATHRVIYDERDAKPTSNASAMIDVDTRMPLELLACNVLKYYREARKRWPGTLAMTYPTTFSRTELQHIRKALQCGWLRMQERKRIEANEAPAAPDKDLDPLCKSLRKVIHGKQDLTTQSDDPLVHLVLDEASAAAFFYLYRRIFEKADERAARKVYQSTTGGLVAFRSEFPNGLNMLLYDCGGGTTDIAIVSARVLDDWRTLQVTVEARSGVRDFGGDDITTQIARLIKAKICNVVPAGANRVTAPEIPNRVPTTDAEWESLGKQLAGYIEETRQKDPLDNLMPTRDIGNPQEERRAAALALWTVAEELKINLGKGEGANPDIKLSLRATDPLGVLLLKGLSAQQQTDTLKKLNQISISRMEVDALIYQKVRRSINNCNALIRRVLSNPETAATSVPAEIHWVVASGSAVKYPFIEQMLRKRLNVAFLEDEDDVEEGRRPDARTARSRTAADAHAAPAALDAARTARRAELMAKLRDRRFLFDQDDAKNATAKGAVLALAVMENPGQQFDLLFDSDLADRLPFDVGYLNMARGQVEPLFAEHTHYRDLQARDPLLIPLGESTRENGGRQFVLYRKFPGDEKWSDYIVYTFDEPIQGPHLEIFYDDTSPYEFRVFDGMQQEGVPNDLSAAEVHRSPAQRGDI